MPRYCSVFGCQSNCDNETEKTSTFSLPKDENLRKAWLRNIPTDVSKLIISLPALNVFRNHASLE